MSDRRSQPLPTSTPSYTISQWDNASQYQTGYSPPVGHFPPTCNSALRQQHLAQQLQYDVMMTQPNVHYQQTNPYSNDRTSMQIHQQTGYPLDRQSAAALAMTQVRQQPQPQSQAYPNTRPQPMPSNPYATPQGYPTQPPPPHPAHSIPNISQYPPSMTFSAPTEGSSQYPASPQRPYSCDLCALSFNRQHDLKRHRDTHTGEKPFLCNGGCGKTFTRKDALKRHQVRGLCFVCFLDLWSSFSLSNVVGSTREHNYMDYQTSKL